MTGVALPSHLGSKNLIIWGTAVETDYQGYSASTGFGWRSEKEAEISLII